MDYLFEIIDFLSNFYWSYIGWGVICVAGVYFTIISRGLQFRAIVNFKKNIKDILLEGSSKTNAGIHPIKLYFASVGGMVGLGNIVGISTALMIGGPGSIFWTIVASVCGMLIKYSEIYLGVKHRVSNKDRGFDGGPMYYLQDAFKNNYIAYFVAFLICLYGVEVYQFTVLVDRIEYSFEFNRIAIILGLLALVIYSSVGGIKRLASICTVIMPAFMIIYIFVALYIIISNITLLPEFFATVFYSAFAGQAPIGGFVGSSMILATYHGMSKAVYSGDIGIGYDSIVQSETNIVNPKKQATLAIYALFTDTLICILTNTMLGVTGAWHNLNHLSETNVVSHTIANYFPHSNLFVTLLLFFAGFTTLIAYIATGIKCAKYLSPKYGKVIYLVYAIFAFIFFCNYSSVKILTVMGLLSGILVLINVSGMIKLRKEIKF